MARQIRGVQIPIAFDLKRLQASVGKAKAEVKGFTLSAKRQIKSLATEIKDALGSRLTQALALGSVAYGLRELIGAAAGFETALKGVMAAAGAAGEDMIAARDAAAELASDGFLSVEQSAQALTHWLKTGFSLSESIQLVKISKDMAAFGNTTGDAAQAVVDLAKGIRTNSIELAENAGWTVRLGQLIGSNIDLANDATQRQLVYTEAVRQWAQVQGNAAEYLEGTAGQLAKLNQEIDQSKIKLGQAFLPAVAGVLPGLIKLAEKVSTVVKWWEIFGAYVAYAATSFGPNVKLLVLEATRGAAQLVAVIALLGQRLIAMGQDVPFLGALFGTPGQGAAKLLEGMGVWAAGVLRKTRETRDKLLQELRYIVEGYDAVVDEINERYAKPEGEVDTPNIPTPTPTNNLTLPPLRVDVGNSIIDDSQKLRDEIISLQPAIKTTGDLIRDGIVDGLLEAWDAAGSLSEVVADSVVTAFDGFGVAVEDAFAAMVSGSESAAKAFSQSMLAALAEVARYFGQYFLGQAAGAIATGMLPGNQIAWAAAAKFTAAAAGMFALAGVLGGVGGSNTGMGPNEASHGFDRAEDRDRGTITLVFPEGVVDFTSPDWQQRLVEGLNAAGDNNHILNIRTRNG